MKVAAAGVRRLRKWLSQEVSELVVGRERPCRDRYDPSAPRRAHNASCGRCAKIVLCTLATPDDVFGPLHIFGVVLDICRLTPSNLIRCRREMNCLAPGEEALCSASHVESTDDGCRFDCHEIGVPLK